jgi:hypothetical protein
MWNRAGEQERDVLRHWQALACLRGVENSLRKEDAARRWPVRLLGVPSG